ncbi:MAG: DPP IV N-terminal domain-containing protein [Candidatus Aminicenantes bacterium]|nr:DPP IV N-terminal domain-containing protein [Candidatus Aminicenantes bacterium]
MKKRTVFILIVLMAFLAGVSGAQDRLKTYPGYEQYAKMSKELQGGGAGGARAGMMGMGGIRWAEDGKSFTFPKDGKTWKFDLATKKAAEAPAPTGQAPDRAMMRAGVERGRQMAEALSPDKKWKALYKDRNLWMADGEGKNEIPVTTEGNEKARIKYATASWVYGEELAQTTAMWWSPDSTKIAFYRFDESKVPDYILQMDQVKLYSKADIEAYPKAGQPNPIAEIYIYDVAAKTTVKIDARDGKPFDDGVVGHYIYRVNWTPDGKELMFTRTNRRQNILELTAADPATGKVRVILREEWPTGWVENSPPMTWLKDNKRFLWISERSGFRNFYLYDVGGKLLATVTNHPFEVANVVKVDEAAGQLYYMARDGANHMMMQLHRVGLDGKKDVRLTDPAFNHQASLSPDGKYFVDTAQTHDVAPIIRLMDAKGKLVADLAKTDTSKTDALGFRKAELFKFKAADGTTDLYGVLQFPSNFDPAKKYPLLVSVYAGPGWNGARESYMAPTALCEYGFLVASFDFRGSSGRGKKAMDSIYLKLGVVEMDDQAAGVKSLYDRPYFDKTRVGVFGTSYGGYASAMCLLRHPDVFTAACAQSSVTSWYQYDSIYTERYMWIPQENKEGYEAGSAMTYAKNLKGRLMLYYGTADNNVHPTNAMQLITALQAAGKNFEVQVGPDRGHTAVNNDRMMEFFIENLMMKTVPLN